MRGSNRDQGTLKEGSSINKKMTKGINTKREEHVSSWGEKKLTLTKGRKRMSRGDARERAEERGGAQAAASGKQSWVKGVYRGNLIVIKGWN
jgi:hypothetical protein